MPSPDAAELGYAPLQLVAAEARVLLERAARVLQVGAVADSFRALVATASSPASAALVVTQVFRLQADKVFRADLAADFRVVAARVELRTTLMTTTVMRVRREAFRGLVVEAGSRRSVATLGCQGQAVGRASQVSLASRRTQERMQLRATTTRHE